MDRKKSAKAIKAEGSADKAARSTKRGKASAYRTGAQQAWEPEDLAKAEGRDPTPENIERARREMDRDGAAAIERTVP